MVFEIMRGLLSVNFLIDKLNRIERIFVMRVIIFVINNVKVIDNIFGCYLNVICYVMILLYVVLC